MIDEDRVEHAESTNRELIELLGTSTPSQCVEKLCNMLSGRSEALNPLVKQITEAGPLVLVGPAGPRAKASSPCGTFPRGRPSRRIRVTGCGSPRTRA